MAATITYPELALRSQNGGWNRERWEQLPADGKRYEVIDGVLYLTTSPSLFHQWILSQLFLLFHRLVDEFGAGITFFAPIGVFMPGCDPVQPDLVVVRTSDRHLLHDKHVNGVPSLLVEVQSSGNPNYDARVKREAYARAGVPEYWIVRPATRDILVLSSPDTANGDFDVTKLFKEDAVVVSSSLDVQFEVARLFAGAPDTTL